MRKACYTNRNRKAKFHLLVSDLCCPKPFKDRGKVIEMFPVQVPLAVAA